MTAQDTIPFLPLAFVAGLFLFTHFSSRRALARERSRAVEIIGQYKAKTTEGSIFLDCAKANVMFGSEDFKRGIFKLEHYSRRFLIEFEGRQFLAIVNSSQTKPFIKALEPNIAEVVSNHKEWRSVA